MGVDTLANRAEEGRRPEEKRTSRINVKAMKIVKKDAQHFLWDDCGT